MQAPGKKFFLYLQLCLIIIMYSYALHYNVGNVPDVCPHANFIHDIVKE